MTHRHEECCLRGYTHTCMHSLSQKRQNFMDAQKLDDSHTNISVRHTFQSPRSHIPITNYRSPLHPPILLPVLLLLPPPDRWRVFCASVGGGVVWEGIERKLQADARGLVEGGGVGDGDGAPVTPNPRQYQPTHYRSIRRMSASGERVSCNG